MIFWVYIYYWEKRRMRRGNWRGLMSYVYILNTKKYMGFDSVNQQELVHATSDPDLRSSGI